MLAVIGSALIYAQISGCNHQNAQNNSALQHAVNYPMTLVGLTESEITKRLGAPVQTDYFADWDLKYLVGQERGLFPIDNEWLVIKIENSIAVDARVITD